MTARAWRSLDTLAHALYQPTAIGARAYVANWHHHIHLIPAAALEFFCERYDRSLGA